jgi:hypothetical protein
MTYKESQIALAQWMLANDRYPAISSDWHNGVQTTWRIDATEPLQGEMKALCQRITAGDVPEESTDCSMLGSIEMAEIAKGCAALPVINSEWMPITV